MSFSLFGKKEQECSLCNKSFNKQVLFGFDSTFRREKEGKALKLCYDCFKVKVTESINDFSYNAVFVSPVINMNAYHFYEFKHIPPTPYEEDSDEDYPPNNIARLLPNGTQACQKCSKTAQHVWFEVPDMEVHFMNIAEIREGFTLSYLCNKCAAEKLMHEIDLKRLKWEEFFPPRDKSGMCISGEC